MSTQVEAQAVPTLSELAPRFLRHAHLELQFAPQSLAKYEECLRMISRLIGETPDELFGQLDAEFGFDLDVCATSRNAKCQHFFSPEQDGLKQPWRGACWMNPPYGPALAAWMAKAYRESLQGATVVCLVPARTDTRWWHDFAMRGEIRLIQGRLRFGHAHSGAPFPSAIIVFRPKRYLSYAASRSG